MAVTQYIGARYVPLFADPIEWDNTNAYEPLTIVSYQGNSYTSRQAVPTGIDISNEQYWALTGNYNAQVEQYRSETKVAVAEVTTQAAAASASATAAATSESNAATSATNAAASESAAAQAMTNAVVSQSAAATSATEAASSESAAATSATQAAASQSAAATSATNAATSAGQAANSANDALTSATNAAASETKVSNLTNAICMPFAGTNNEITFPSAGTQSNYLTIANVVQPTVEKFTNVDLYYITKPGYMQITNTSSTSVAIDGSISGFGASWAIEDSVYCYLVGPDGSIGDIKTGRVIPCYINSSGVLKVAVTLPTLLQYFNGNESYMLVLPQGIVRVPISLTA